MPQHDSLVAEIPSFAQSIVDTVRGPLLMLDPALRVRSANRAFYHAFRVSQAETEGQLIYELGNGQWNIPTLRTLLEDIIPKSTVFDGYELEHDFPAIGRKVMLLNARRLRAGDHSELLVLALEDVTEQRRVHEVERRYTTQLQESYRRLQVLEKQRDDLTNMIVHDLRTPLTSVMAGMQTMELAGELNQEQREMLDIALTGGNTLLEMINDLLDLEKLQSGSMQLEYAPLSPAELVAAAIHQVASLAQREQLTLLQEVDAALPSLLGDEHKLRRVLVNLLGNALKFTPKGGTVTVQARYGKDGASVQFIVRDTGEGIPAEAFDLIFEKFGQVESRRRGRTLSTGLGLAFCKLAVQAHGGEIKVESVPGQGSTFCFAIPLTPQPSPTASEAVGEP